MKTYFAVIAVVTLLYACNTPADNKNDNTIHKQKKVVERKKPAADITYHFENGKAWAKLHTNETTVHLAEIINRADIKHLAAMDSIIIPDDTTADIAYYMPFPLSVPLLKDIDKIIFFSYAAQAFGAYENGELVYAGATNMGRKKDPTPTGLFFTNWKAEKTTSTFNDEWDLKWNFNIENKLGVGWHQYKMPGYPASHSCLRLLEKDAIHLYYWADQWVLDKKEQVKTKGTPVVVFSSYDFAGPKPWKKLISDTHAFDISEKQINDTTAAYMNEIKASKGAAE